MMKLTLIAAALIYVIFTLPPLFGLLADTLNGTGDRDAWGVWGLGLILVLALTAIAAWILLKVFPA